jgi:hypothetical protein
MRQTLRQTYAPRGAPLIKSPSVRQLYRRRGALTACGLLLLALGSGVVGSITHSGGVPLGRPHTGPFSYFPSE